MQCWLDATRGRRGHRDASAVSVYIWVRGRGWRRFLPYTHDQILLSVRAARHTDSESVHRGASATLLGSDQPELVCRGRTSTELSSC